MQFFLLLSAAMCGYDNTLPWVSMMTRPGSPLRSWLSPVYLSNSWISHIGLVVVTSASVLWILLLPTTLRGEVVNPYFEIVLCLALPAVFIGTPSSPARLYLIRGRSQQTEDQSSSATVARVTHTLSGWYKNSARSLPPRMK